jgi:flagellin-like protein
VSRRAVSPVIGVVLIVAVTVVLAAVVGAFAVGVSGQTNDAPQAAITAERTGNELTLTHHSGDPLDVNELTVRIFVDGEPLEKQPDVPATAGMEGFNGIPSGAFHASKNNTWTAGETTSLTIASTTNSPQPSAGSQVTVKIYSEGKAVATARA